ncbi:MAG: hypothetical protein WAO35_06860 [Terriglobia bacterium]
MTGNTALEITAVGAGSTAAILAGVAMSRAGNSNTAATAAISAADAATSTANAANSTAAAAAAANAQLLAECLSDLQETGTYTSPFVLSQSQCNTLP